MISLVCRDETFTTNCMVCLEPCLTEVLELQKEPPKPKPKEGDMRLVDGDSAGSGRVEVYHGGRFGSICDDNFDVNAAVVVCRQLGMKGGTPKWHSYYGQSRGPVWMGQFHCSGTESKLVACRGNDWKEHGCKHSNDAGVVCGQFLTAD